MEDDLISPGRLPRKNFNKLRIDASDDYEDESEISTVEKPENPDNSSSEESSVGHVLSTAVNSTSGLILEITAESSAADKVSRNSPPVNLPSLTGSLGSSGI